MNLIKGLKALKVLQKQHDMNKEELILSFTYDGEAKPTEEFKIKKYSPSYEFYDPFLVLKLSYQNKNLIT